VSAIKKLNDLVTVSMRDPRDGSSWNNLTVNKKYIYIVIFIFEVGVINIFTNTSTSKVYIDITD